MADMHAKVLCNFAKYLRIRITIAANAGLMHWLWLARWFNANDQDESNSVLVAQLINIGMKQPKYRSKFEARCGESLPKSFKHEPIKLPYTIEHNYIPDFVDEKNKIIIEAKGYLRNAAEKAKMVAVRKKYPDWTIYIWFMNPDAPVSKRTKTTNREWANKNGMMVYEPIR